MITHQTNANGLLQFSRRELTIQFSDLFTAKVGAVPKSKQASLLSEGNTPFVHSSTIKDGSLAYYDLGSEWIRPWTGDRAQLFVNCKTRSKTPFFTTSEPMAWDGSVIGLYPTDLALGTIHNFASYLNELDWFDLGCEDATGRKHFSVGVFERMMI